MIKIKHTLKIQEDGVTISGRITHTEFSGGSKKGDGVHIPIGNDFYISSYYCPQLTPNCLHVWGRNDDYNNDLIFFIYHSPGRAKKVMEAINSITIPDTEEKITITDEIGQEVGKESEEMKEGKIVVAWDTDDTLLIPNVAFDEPLEGYPGHPHHENIKIYKWFKECGCYMIIWSSTGLEWAERWAKEFGLEYDEIRIKQKYDDIDISIDDCTVDLATTNIKVKRVNNSISRKDWNREKR